MRCSGYSSAAQRPASLAPASLDRCYHLLLVFTPPAAAVALDQHQSANCYVTAEHVFQLHFCCLLFCVLGAVPQFLLSLEGKDGRGMNSSPAGGFGSRWGVIRTVRKGKQRGESGDKLCKHADGKKETDKTEK